MLLQDKVVIVSGIGPGLGRSIAVRSAEQGADVVLAARTASRLDEVAKEVTALGRRALAVPTDVADPAAAERFGNITEAYEILTDPAENVNWVHGLGRPQRALPPWLYLALLIAAFSLVLYRPPHLVFGYLPFSARSS